MTFLFLALLWQAQESVKVPKNTPVKVPKATKPKSVRAPGHPVPQGRSGDLLLELVAGTMRAVSGEGDDPPDEEPSVVDVINQGVHDGWAEGDHGDVSQRPHQQENYQRNLAKVMDKFRGDMETVYTEGQAYAISPEPDPDKDYGIANSCGTARVLVWLPLGALEVRCGEGSDSDDATDGEIQLNALEGPELPSGWGSMTPCERATWQLRENRIAVGYRMVMPAETEPRSLSLRPESFYAYFEDQHDWCDPCYLEESCDPCPSRDDSCYPLRLPQNPRLPMALDGEAIVWQIDYQIGKTGLDEGDLEWESESVAGPNNNEVQVPVLRPGAFQWNPTNLPELVQPEVYCGEDE